MERETEREREREGERETWQEYIIDVYDSFDAICDLKEDSM